MAIGGGVAEPPASPSSVDPPVPVAGNDTAAAGEAAAAFRLVEGAVVLPAADGGAWRSMTSSGAIDPAVERLDVLAPAGVYPLLTVDGVAARLHPGTRAVVSRRAQAAPVIEIVHGRAVIAPARESLASAMRQTVQALLASPIPVVVHVSPDGARAASAGTFVLYSAHVAAMAPATTLGAATPVPLNLPMAPRPATAPDQAPQTPADAENRRASEPSTPPASAADAKAVHDAAACIRGLAELRGRNAEWAERAMREAVSLTSQEALRQGVIDLIADSPQQLLRALDGRTVRLGDRQVVLRTATLERRALPPRAHERLIATLTQPSVALLLLLLGVWALVLEFSQPGFGVAGAFGAISLLLALYALQMLPFNVVGLALLALGVVLIVAAVLAAMAWFRF
jgi:hypothetical protein